MDGPFATELCGAPQGIDVVGSDVLREMVMKRLALLIGLAVLLCATACVSFVGGEGGGGISPSQFKFSRVVSPKGKGPGGWKTARLVITLVRASGQNVQDVFCQIQVQVPRSMTMV